MWYPFDSPCGKIKGGGLFTKLLTLPVPDRGTARSGHFYPRRSHCPGPHKRETSYLTRRPNRVTMTLPKEIVKAAVMGGWCFCTLFSGACLYDTSGISFCKVQNLTFLTFGESHNFQGCNFMFWSVFVGLCAKREVSPNAVAKALGLSSGSVTLWENGAVPRSTTIRKIADYFGVSPESFLAEADDPAIKKAPDPKIEEFVPTMKDWEEQAENWTDDQILQAMQKLVEIQQRRRSDGR